MTAEADVRARVQAFVADYHERWSRAGSTEPPPMGDFQAMQVWMMNQHGPGASDLTAASFDRWRAEVEELEAAHGTPSLKTGYDGALSMHPDHDPSAEVIRSVGVDGPRATVHSSMPANVEQFFEYQLRLVDGDWRIDKLLRSLDPPGVPVVEPAAAEALLALTSDDAPLPPISEHVELDVPLLFTAGRRVRLSDEELTTDVVSLGTLTTSGVLTAIDLGWARFMRAVLSRRVPPGSYRVEVAIAGVTTVALRLVLGDGVAVEHRVAEFTDGTREVSVDAANVALADARTLLSVDAQRVAAAFQEHTQDLAGGGHAAFALGGEAVDIVMVSSGFGDGGYPCYWGLDDDGALVELVVDFVVLAEDLTRTRTAAFEPGLRLGCTIAPGEDSYDISHPSDRYVTWRVLGTDGTVLVDGQHLGSFVSQGRSTSTWHSSGPPAGSVIEVTEHLGYRHV